MPHAETDRIARAMTRCLVDAAACRQEVCRTSRPRYASARRLLSGAGARRWGGRWNPPGVAAVYGSLDEATALAEMQQRHKRVVFSRKKVMPQLFVALHVRLRCVLDLTQGHVRHALGVSLERMCEEDWERLQRRGQEAVTQAIGRLAWERRLDGLLVPSAADRPHGKNLVVFPDHAGGRWARIYNATELPPEPPGGG
jgi:RES domain-containing protein